MGIKALTTIYNEQGGGTGLLDGNRDMFLHSLQDQPGGGWRSATVTYDTIYADMYSRIKAALEAEGWGPKDDDPMQHDSNFIDYTAGFKPGAKEWTLPMDMAVYNVPTAINGSAPSDNAKKVATYEGGYLFYLPAGTNIKTTSSNVCYPIVDGQTDESAVDKRTPTVPNLAASVADYIVSPSIVPGVEVWNEAGTARRGYGARFSYGATPDAIMNIPKQTIAYRTTSGKELTATVVRTQTKIGKASSFVLGDGIGGKLFSSATDWNTVVIQVQLIKLA